jgi:hypothetical protein
MATMAENLMATLKVKPHLGTARKAGVWNTTIMAALTMVKIMNLGIVVVTNGSRSEKVIMQSVITLPSNISGKIQVKAKIPQTPVSTTAGTMMTAVIVKTPARNKAMEELPEALTKVMQSLQATPGLKLWETMTALRRKETREIAPRQRLAKVKRRRKRQKCRKWIINPSSTDQQPNPR